MSALYASASFALDIATTAQNTYDRQQSTGQVICNHPNLKQKSNEFVIGQYIKTNFEHEGLEFSVKILLKSNKVRAKFISNDLNLSASVNRKKNVKFNFKNLTNDQGRLVSEHELKKMFCYVGVYYDIPVKLKQQKIHINVHPHQRYDRYGFTTQKVETYFTDDSYQHIVLLDNDDFRRSQNLKSFMLNTAINNRSKQEFSLPTVKISAETQIYGASAGHNIFTMELDNIDVLYTGGNLNFCILNNTRNLLDGYLQYSAGGVLNITYDLDAIVAQKGSWLGPDFLDNRKYNSIIARDIFRSNDEFANKYHQIFKKHFQKDKLGYKKSYFKTLNYSYQYGEKIHRATIKGHGKGEYSVNIDYINE